VYIRANGRVLHCIGRIKYTFFELNVCRKIPCDFIEQIQAAGDLHIYELLEVLASQSIRGQGVEVANYLQGDRRWRCLTIYRRTGDGVG
jgi:hypothetical protein